MKAAAPSMPLLSTTSKDFGRTFDRICERGLVDGRQVETEVRAIMEAVRRKGDRALIQLTRKFDGLRLTPATLEVDRRTIRAAGRGLPAAALRTLEVAAARIARFHAKARPRSWRMDGGPGVKLGEQVTPLDRVGVYAPGGKATYPSSVLMAAVPARAAGVGEIVLATPASGGKLSPAVLAAAEIAGVDRVFRIGGAQAIAALAYGTRTVPRVDKIVGPGNIYVATAKRLAFGEVGIDAIAGPTEILILADQTANPEWLAADLLSQAEHDEDARAILISTSRAILEKTRAALARQMARAPRRRIIEKALARGGALIRARSAAEAVGLANRYAPEHLELAVARPSLWLRQIRHAGAIFLGHNSTVVLGDFVAGPNHVLPTAGTARFFSPLGAQDFVKRSSVIEVSRAGIQRLGPHARTLAGLEGLAGHAEAVRVRMEADRGGRSRRADGSRRKERRGR
ncbi:MAG: histidinol dehydrogenase [Deltaproteobacteria bacterium]|nr:histidinol dehydrogenase [Deltaproteobacteria bacterium]